MPKDIYLKSSEKALTYKDLVDFLAENPQHLSNPIYLHDDGNGVWTKCHSFRLDSEEKPALVLESSEETE